MRTERPAAVHLPRELDVEVLHGEIVPRETPGPARGDGAGREAEEDV